MTDLRERVARALQTHCDVDPGIDGLIASVETLCREFAAEQARKSADYFQRQGDEEVRIMRLERGRAFQEAANVLRYDADALAKGEK